ncbi:hypothetical protein Deipr_2352 (plasmid) [Deinococcus proteolyticus MRP]|uniref:Uncharacterized protein n=1 Tax=Deinococcus proteolyticus (strain ATCC 35074 / DSM 20540 / JCM 6276 / NBRC 101906 / NCIMB 13154 / VKM Ac-1939 / CCM 2703 / MRP) TaxID=693977 RepID=F0RQB7_DEIPM|nr:MULTISPECIES: hypothetical protein [Deinococcus]ADY27476.1 hypothetical protein Deipr_2352 [Deinococcus proteolyticus MRP]MCY1703798.1 hypothetical protein [Deinococcus sp. SL84]
MPDLPYLSTTQYDVWTQPEGFLIQLTSNQTRGHLSYPQHNRAELTAEDGSHLKTLQGPLPLLLEHAARSLEETL